MDTDKTFPYAIVIGMDTPTGLQTARILHRNGIPVIGFAKNPGHYCCKTNSCEKIIRCNTDSAELIESLVELGPTLGRDAVVFACSDISVIHLSRNKERLTDWYRVPIPEAEVVEKLIDKESFYRYADQNNLPIPKTTFLYSIEEAKSVCESIEFPVIIKPPYRPERWKEEVKEKAFVASDLDQLVAKAEPLFDYVDKLIVQQIILGPEENHRTGNCYFNSLNVPLAVYTSKKIRQWPLNTGEGCASQSVIDETVAQVMLKLFSSVGFYGLGYVEMKIDERSGNYLIIEPNIGRPTGRSAAAEASGVELLYTMYCDALGWQLPEKRIQDHTGVKWFFLQKDIRAAFRLIVAGKLSLWGWLSSMRGRKVFAVFSLRDPLPMFFSLFNRFRRRRG